MSRWVAFGVIVFREGWIYFPIILFRCICWLLECPWLSSLWSFWVVSFRFPAQWVERSGIPSRLPINWSWLMFILDFAAQSIPATESCFRGLFFSEEEPWFIHSRIQKNGFSIFPKHSSLLPYWPTECAAGRVFVSRAGCLHWVVGFRPLRKQCSSQLIPAFLPIDLSQMKFPLLFELSTQFDYLWFQRDDLLIL